jgi:hypothetical protein
MNREKGYVLPLKRLVFIVVMALLLIACSMLQPPMTPTPTATRTAAPVTASVTLPGATPTDAPPPTGSPTKTKTPGLSPTDPKTDTPSPPPVSPQPTPTLSPVNPLAVSVDYTVDRGAYDASRILNGSVGGYVPLANYNWLADGLDEMAAIDMEMIRMDHLTDDTYYRAVWRDSDGNLQFDFSRLNRAIVPILQAGMEPLMCLSYKPLVLDPVGQEKAPPTDMNEWAKVVSAYVTHFERIGYPGLHWEVWNEPDLGFFFQGTPQQYVELYVTTARAIKEVDPTARVGGAADSSVGSPGGKLQPLLAYVQAHPDVPLDFVSYHDYADPDGDGLPPYRLDWNVEAVESLLEANGLAPRDIFITEWHLTPSLTTGPGAPSDTHVGAAAAAVRIYNLLQYPNVKRAFFFSPIEGFKPEEIFSGDLGLLTVNYHRKAMYNLFEMVSYMGGTRVGAQVEGENAADHASYAVATRDEETRAVSVLAWNYWDQDRTLDLSVRGLPYLSEQQNLEVTRYLLDAEHANYYRDYAAGLRGYAVGPTEALVPLESRILTTADTFVQRFAMPRNSLLLILLEPTDRSPTPGPVVTPPALPPRNVAAAKPVQASSTLPINGWGSWPLVDENRHSLRNTLGWSSEYLDNPDAETWVQVDLGEPVRVDTIVLYPRDDEWHEGDGFPVDFKIQGSADREGPWTDLAVHTDYDPGEPARQRQTFTFTPDAYRFIRVVATELDAVEDEGYAMQFAEMEVIEAD